MSIRVRSFWTSALRAGLIAVLVLSWAACRDEQGKPATPDIRPSTNAAEGPPVVLRPRFVEVGGNRVRVLTLGLDERRSGDPVFVLLAGAGTTLESWDQRFTRSILAMAPVVAYDRPGMGGSEFDGRDPTPENVADHLHALLDVLSVPPPYILVGHSWGGPLILQFTASYPTDVVGLVYLDASHPNRPAPDFPPDPVDRAAAEALLDSIQAGPDVWPVERRAEFASEKVRLDFWMTPPDQRIIPPNPDVPTAVVLGTVVSGLAPDRAEAEALQQQRIDEVRAWLRDVAQLHFVTCSTCGHFVQRDDVELSAEAVRRVFNWSRQPR